MKDEVRVLCDAIDELREEFQWVARNREPLPPPLHIATLPLDPAAPDSHEFVNVVKPQGLAARPPRQEDTPPRNRQQSLW